MYRCVDHDLRGIFAFLDRRTEDLYDASPLDGGAGEALGILDEPSMVEPATIPAHFEDMHCREGPFNRKVSPCYIYQVLAYPAVYLHFQPLHPPLLQMPPPIQRPDGIRLHPLTECVLLQRHRRCLC